MGLETLVLIFMLVGGLISSLGMLVWPGADNVPDWVVYVSIFLAACGGAAAFALIVRA